MSTRRLGFSVLLVLLAFLACVLFATPVFADSQVRIVRLSSVEGNVQIDRSLGQGYEKAFLNLPVTQGVKLQTRQGRAEIEFEDGSTVRLVPGTVVEFPELALRDSGVRASTMVVQQGGAYVNYSGKKTDEFTLQFARESARLTDAVELRLLMDSTGADLAVFKGNLQVENSGTMVAVGKKQTVTIDFTAQDKSTLAKSVAEAPFDEWNKEQEQYHDRYLAKNSFNSSPYSYGVSDLNYYGTFFNAPGYGMVWQPYLTGAGWDPFMNGSWAYYPGAGYTWVSAYPWGWMPYYYGSWAFIPSYGWAWQPGNSWSGWNRFPTVSSAPGGFIPPQPPRSGQGTLMVNRGAAFAPAMAGRNKIVVRNDSAGLGIPRGSVRDLGKVSAQARQQGTVTTKIQMPSRPAPSVAGPSMGANPNGGMRPQPSSGASRGGSPSVSPRSMPSSPSMSPGMGGGGMSGGGRSAPSGGGGGRPPR